MIKNLIDSIALKVKSQTKKDLLTYSIILAVIIMPLTALGIAIDHQFPDDNGHQRSILCVEGEFVEDTYYIVDDYITVPKGGDASVYFHCLGEVNSSNDNSILWKKDGTFLNLTILLPCSNEIELEPVTGKVYWSDGENDNYPTQGVKITSKDTNKDKSIRIISLFYGYKEGEEYILPIESIDTLKGNDVSNFHAWNINGSDVFLVPNTNSDGYVGEMIEQERANKQKISYPTSFLKFETKKTQTHRCLIQLDSSNVLKSMYSYGTFLEDSDYEFPSDFFFTTLKAHIYSTDSNYKIYSNDTDVGLPEKIIVKSSSPPDTSSMEHPFLYMNSLQKLDVESRIDGSIPQDYAWQSMYDGTGSSPSNILDAAFKAYMENDGGLMNTTIVKLLNMTEKLGPLRQNLHRGSWVIDYVIAYDFLYNNMSLSERADFEKQAFAITYPSADAILNNVCPYNNHRVVSLSAYGVLGLIMGNKTMIQLMQDQIDHYLNNCMIRGGACYEGPSYARYTFEYATDFMFALKNCGGYDYYVEPAYLEFLDFTSSTLCPDNTHPLYEDAAANTNLGSIILRSIEHVQTEYPELAKQMRWYCEQIGYNNCVSGATTNNILMCSEIGTETLKPTGNLLYNGSYIYFDSGHAGLGTGPTGNDTMLRISNKNYDQSHVHYDENSIELWIQGEKMLSNAGYPHWGKPGHYNTTTTAGNNAVTIAGHPQYEMRSDGFESISSSANLTVLESPSYLSYVHPFSNSHFPWVWLLVGLGCMVYALILEYRKKNSHNNHETINDLEETVSNNMIEQTHNGCVIKYGTIIISVFKALGFLVAFYYIYSYMWKAIQHMEVYPDQKDQLHTYLLYSIIGLSIAVFVFSMFQEWLRHKILDKSVLRDKNTGEILKDKEKHVQIGHLYRFKLFSAIYYLIWFIVFGFISAKALYDSVFHVVQFGSTVISGLEDLKNYLFAVSVVWMIFLLFKHLMFYKIIKNPQIHVHILRRDIIHLFLFIILLILAVLFVSTFSIESIG